MRRSADRTTGALDRPSFRPDRTSTKGQFRPDVEGLRAVAVVAVLLYHAGLSFVPGGYVGVDVFFVISGFLITGLLLREIERTGTVSIMRFYSRRAKRLLPMTVVVLATVVVLSWLLLDPVRMDEVSFDVIAAGLYVMNWLLAIQAADYFGAGLQASPVQHFWTLAVEEQFYLVWPTLLLAVAWWCRRTQRNLRSALGVVFAVVTISSLAYSVYSTGYEAGAAYFSTLTRGWELALGGALAIVPVSWLKLPKRLAAALVSAGLAAIAYSAVRFNDDTLFPGYAALLPTLGTAAIIAAGFASTTAMPARLLTLAPVRHVGRISYSWYLWHWPPLVFGAALWGRLSALEGLVVLAASYIPAVLTHRWVEKPFHHSETLTRYPRKGLALGGACSASAVGLGLLLFVLTPSVPKVQESEVAGAAAMLGGDRSLQKSALAVHPSPREAEKQRSQMYADGCHLDRPDEESPECAYGNPSSETTVVLFGDSHAMQWFPALNELARERNWRLVGLTKSACPPAEVHRYSASLRREYSECDAWRERTFKRIVEEERPSMIVTSMLNPYRVMENGEPLDRKASEEALEEGYVSTIKRLRSTGAEVVVINDIPHPDKDIPKCVSQAPDRLQDCAIPRSKACNYPSVNAHAAKKAEGTHFIDPTPTLCLERVCPAVIGDALVYRNGAHLTPTYVRTLTPWLAERLPTQHNS
ncbi:MAG: acyltransferase [Actinomycetota bacterium]|nr:acyltransferase [Actinomycetota bacterium]